MPSHVPVLIDIVLACNVFVRAIMSSCALSRNHICHQVFQTRQVKKPILSRPEKLAAWRNLEENFYSIQKNISMAPSLVRNNALRLPLMRDTWFSAIPEWLEWFEYEFSWKMQRALFVLNWWQYGNRNRIFDQYCDKVLFIIQPNVHTQQQYALRLRKHYLVRQIPGTLTKRNKLPGLSGS